MQWRGQLPVWAQTHVDLGQVGGVSIFGAPANGTLTLLVDNITATLPPLSDPEQAAMEELQSTELGVGVPTDVWDPATHPCTWGGDHVGLSPSCCLTNDDAGNLQTASISSIDLNLWWHLHRGARDTAAFVGTIPNSIANLSSLRQLHVGPSQISGTIPAGLADLPLHRLVIDNTQQWGEMPAVTHDMQFWVTRSANYISGTVPDSLGSVDSLRTVWMSGMARISGTFPSLCGHESFNLMLARNTHQISGTIHALPHADHGSHAYNNGSSCFIGEGFGNVVLAHNKLSGTINENWACGQNGTSSFTGNTMVAAWNTLLSGTLPTCFVDGATRLALLYFPYNRFTGQIPNLNLSTLMYGMRFEGNDFEQFPDSFPEGLRMFKANDNPRMLASGAEVAQMLSTAPELNDFSVTVDNTLATSIARGGGEIGPLPDIGWTEMKPTLPLDCRFGEPCAFSLELVIGIDYVPLRSMGVDFEIHMTNSPVNLNDQIIEIGHLISNTSEHWSGTFNPAEAGRRRRAQAPATTENAEELSGGEEGNAEGIGSVLTGEIGHLANHLDGLNLNRTLFMTDTDDGWVHAVLPADWFPQTGRYNFRIFGKTNYCQVNESGVMSVLPPGSCATDVRCDCDAHQQTLLEFYDKSLWFVNMHPIVCHDTLATPNAAGSTCQCPPGSAPPSGNPCEKGDSYCECSR